MQIKIKWHPSVTRGSIAILGHLRMALYVFVVCGSKSSGSTK